jgi:hypothetical protein
MTILNPEYIFGCPQCKVLFLSDTDNIVSPCPVCGFAVVSKVDFKYQIPNIELILPDTSSPQSFEALISEFIQPTKFKPTRLNCESLLCNMKKIYFPKWLLDVSTQGNWNATVGFDYQVESAQESYQQGQWISQKVNETRINWEHRTGLLENTYNNIITDAQSKDNWITSIIKHSNYQKSEVYSSTLKPLVLIIPDITPDQAFPNAASYLKKVISNECQKACRAQHIKSFDIKNNYTNHNWSLLIFPFFHTWYQDDEGNPHSIWINPQTKTIAGDRHASTKSASKYAMILFAVSLTSMLLTVLSGFLSAAIPPLVIAAFLLLMVTIITAGVGFYCLIYPSQWNKQNQKYWFKKSAD